MPLTILDALRGLKQDPTRLIDRDAIVQACREVGHKWRSSIFRPVNLIQLFLSQILHGNTAIQHLPRLSGLRFTESAYCQAHTRLPLKLLCLLLRRVADPADSGRRRGPPLADIGDSGHVNAEIGGQPGPPDSARVAGPQASTEATLADKQPRAELRKVLLDQGGCGLY